MKQYKLTAIIFIILFVLTSALAFLYLIKGSLADSDLQICNNLLTDWKNWSDNAESYFFSYYLNNCVNYHCDNDRDLTDCSFKSNKQVVISLCKNILSEKKFQMVQP